MDWSYATRRGMRRHELLETSYIKYKMRCCSSNSQTTLASIMDVDAKRATYHSSTYMASGAAMMSFAPINRIHQHICAFHVYAYVIIPPYMYANLTYCSTDPTRHVRAHHFCTHRSADFHQCVVYDSGESDARLIGIEYIVTEKVRIVPPYEHAVLMLLL